MVMVNQIITIGFLSKCYSRNEPSPENAFEQADVNDDGKVNQIDLNYFNSLAPVPSVWGDINNDGIFIQLILAYFRSYLLGIEIPYEPVYRKNISGM